MSKSAHELTRREMKAPDKFQVAATRAATWATGHRRPLVAGAAAIVLAVVVAFAAWGWRSSSHEEAGTQLYRTLVAAGGEISSVPLAGFAGPLYKDDAERQRAVLEAARKLREQHPSSRAAATAALAEGNAHYRLGDRDAALRAYQAYLDSAPREDSLRFAALEGIARIHEAKNELAEAAKAWERAGEVKFFADHAALERARVLARAGQVEEARKILSGFGETFKSSPLRAEADDRLAKLGK